MIVATLLTGFLMLQNAASLPSFPQTNGDTLYQEIGMCMVESRNLQKWSQALVVAIKERDAEIERLKAELGKK